LEICRLVLGGYMNKKKILVVIDMQNDFIDGALGTPEAQAIVPKVVEKIKNKNYDLVIMTQDVHYGDNYMNHREGRYLPVPHCIDNTWGWARSNDVVEALFETIDSRQVICREKNNFALEDNIKGLILDFIGGYYQEYFSMNDQGENFEFEFVGLCTDICVVSNAFALRQAFPEAEITIDASCCAGTTPELHRAALMTMKSCQMNIINEDI